MIKTATNPETGEKVVEIGGKWLPYTESRTNPQTNQRAFLIDNKWEVLGDEKTEPRREEKPYSEYTLGDVEAEDVIGAAVEPAMTLGSTAVAMPIAGLSGIATGIAQKFGWTDAEAHEVVEDVLHGMTYQPQTKGGQAATDVVMYPFEKLHEGARWAGTKTLEATDSPVAATAVETGIMSVPMAFGARHGMKTKKPTVLPEAVESAVKAPYRVPAKLAKDGAVFLKNAIENRLKGGEDKALARTIVDMVGEENIRPLIASLEKADKGVTSGQAAVNVGSMEFSALQKFAETLDPTGYGKILKRQQLERQQLLTEEFGRTPEDLASAELALKRASEERYSPDVMRAEVDPRSGVQRLEGLAERAAKREAVAKLGQERAMQDAGIQATESAQLYRPQIDKTGTTASPGIGSVQQALIERGRQPTQGKTDVGGTALEPKMTPKPVVQAMQESVAREGGRTMTEAMRDAVIGKKAEPRENLARTTAAEKQILAEEFKAIAGKRATARKLHSDLQKFVKENMKGEDAVGLETLLDRPSIQDALKVVERQTREAPGKFGKFPEAGEPFNVAQLQLIKRAIAENMKQKAMAVEKGGEGLLPLEAANITNTVEMFTQFLRKKSPEFAKAEDAYAAEIKPITQMKVGQELATELRGKATPKEYVGMSKEYMDSYLKSIERLEKKGKLKDLTDAQKEAVAVVTDQLFRDKVMAEQAGTGTKAMNLAFGTMYDMPKFNMLDRTILVINTILRRIEGKNTARALKHVKDEMKNPHYMGRILKEALPKEKEILNSTLRARRPIAISGAIASGDVEDE